MSPSDYVMEGGRILSDENPLLLRYVRDQEDVSMWDALFIEAMTMHMAWVMAYPITKSASAQDEMGKRFASVIRMARTVNGQEDTPESFGDTPLFSIRMA